jgi:hypothetical protein
MGDGSNFSLPSPHPAFDFDGCGQRFGHRVTQWTSAHGLDEAARLNRRLIKTTHPAAAAANNLN